LQIGEANPKGSYPENPNNSYVDPYGEEIRKWAEEVEIYGVTEAEEVKRAADIINEMLTKVGC
jgi:hypothetical protein